MDVCSTWMLSSVSAPKSNIWVKVYLLHLSALCCWAGWYLYHIVLLLVAVCSSLKIALITLFVFRLFVLLFLLPPHSHSWASAISSPQPHPWPRKTWPLGIASRQRLKRRRDSQTQAWDSPANFGFITFILLSHKQILTSREEPFHLPGIFWQHYILLQILKEQNCRWIQKGGWNKETTQEITSHD